MGPISAPYLLPRGRVRVVVCAWSCARGRVRVVVCAWSCARGRVRVVVVVCAWSCARGRVRVVVCAWSCARGLVRVVVCAWSCALVRGNLALHFGHIWARPADASFLKLLRLGCVIFAAGLQVAIRLHRSSGINFIPII